MRETAIPRSQATQRLVTIPMLAAVAFVLQYLEFQVPLMPTFLKLDFSTLPGLIGALMYGPMAGVIVEVLKNALHMLFKNTDGLLIGELANVVAGASFIVAAVSLQRLGQGKKNFLAGLALGTLLMTAVMAVANAYLLLPAYAALYQVSLEQLVAQFQAESVWSLVLYGIVPFNLIKGVLLSLVAYPLYAKLAPRLRIRSGN
ncbi:ECF transporter S component [Brevibacillus composti]|uniref:Riboflavin transporter n=1 Tax=Brevibacillus composti TaxID=2796470 RepID=A0A7T5EJJ6_9BACL|nr:ECF transporter S component [Brevibacillus composti]QQE73779.1 ECF transporter S component [Brevibacillus composti]QUO40863.1 ECF transporter S component [Brevibacillus composti]